MSLRDQLLESLGCEYQRVGPFRLRIYRQLLGNEEEYTERLTRDAQRSSMQMYAVAHDAATAAGQDPRPFMAVLDRLSSDKESVNIDQLYAMFGPYFSALMAVVDTMPLAKTMRDGTVHMLLLSRGEYRVGEEDPWTKVKDAPEPWTLETTASFPEDILEGLWRFFQLERHGWPNEAVSGKQPAAAATKRRRAARGLAPSPS